MSAQDYDELARPLPIGRPPGMRIERVEAYREGSAQAAVRADRKAILSVLGFALSHADPFPMLRALAADLGGEQKADPARVACWKGMDPCQYTCEGIASGRYKSVAPASPPTLNRNGAGARASLIAAGHTVHCAEFGCEDDEPTAGCPACIAPSPPTLAEQVRARLGKDGEFRLKMAMDRDPPYTAEWRREYADGVVSDLRWAEGASEDACFRAVLAWEDDADRKEPEHAGPPMSLAHASPPTIPGPTEHADMLLRFRYRDDGSGVFVVPDGGGIGLAVAVPRPKDYHVLGLSVRIVYEHTKADAAAALDCAESWQARMMGAGAKEVVVEGREVER